MKKIIVPVDFSDTSKNAALYAAKIASTISATVTLVNIVDPIAAGSDGTPLVDESDARKKITELALDNILLSVREVAPELELSSLAVESNSIPNALRDIVKQQNADLLVIGITGSSLVERLAIGSNTINIIHENICPVIVVPPFANYKEIKKVAFATDFKTDNNSDALQQIRQLLQPFDASLLIVNVNSNNEAEQSEEYISEKQKLDLVFAAYNPEYYFIKQDDFSEAMGQFAADHHIDLILIIPRKHSFLSTVFSTSHTRQLAYHSHVPVLAIHE